MKKQPKSYNFNKISNSKNIGLNLSIINKSKIKSKILFLLKLVVKIFSKIVLRPKNKSNHLIILIIDTLKKVKENFLK
jgi:hypothetical protein